MRGLLLRRQQEPGRIRCVKKYSLGTICGFLQFIHGEGQRGVLGENYDPRASDGSVASAPPGRAVAGTPALRGPSALAQGSSSGSLREALPSAFPRQGVWRGQPKGERRRALWPERGANQHQRMSQSGLSSPFRPQHPAVETPPQKRTSRVTINLTKLCPLRNENADLWRRWELAPALQS